MAHYDFDATNPVDTTAMTDHAAEFNAHDTVWVKQGGRISAAGANAWGIHGALNNHLRIDGSVSSAKSSALVLDGAATVSVGETGIVSGSSHGIHLAGGSVTNAGHIQAAGTAIFVPIGSPFATFTLYNEGTITGEVYVHTGAVATNRGTINGHVVFSAGNDLYFGREGVVTGDVVLGGGNDRFYGGGGSETIQGGLGDDLIDGGAGIDTVHFDEAGTVTVDLRRTDAQNTGASGIDTFIGIENLSSSGNGSRAFTGNHLNNDLRSMGGNDTLDGGGGNDSLHSALGADMLLGGQGNDTLHGSYGDDTLNGGDGFDVVIFTDLDESESMTVNLARAVASTGSYGTDTYISIEGLVGTAVNDHFTGNSAANTFWGKGGNDTLKGAGGADRLDGGTGIDRLEGGTGNDIYYVDTTGDTIVETSSGGTADLVYAYASYSLARTNYVERLYASGSGSISLTGNSLSNIIKGNAGHNRILSGSGNDTLYGGSGNDVLYGGSGSDKFVFDTAPSSRSNKDQILDWDYRYDTIYLENAVFKALRKSGTLSASSFKLGSKASDGNDYVGYNKATGDVWYDSNGSKSGGQVTFANIGKNKTLAYTDFYVV